MTGFWIGLAIGFPAGIIIGAGGLWAASLLYAAGDDE